MRDFDKVEDIGAHERGIFGGQENYCIMWIASLSKLYFGNQIKEDKMVLACGIYWWEDKYIQGFWRDMKETDPLEDLVVDGSMMI